MLHVFTYTYIAPTLFRITKEKGNNFMASTYILLVGIIFVLESVVSLFIHYSSLDINVL